MTKTEIIAKIEDLFDELRANEYDSWYNRSTITSWEDSYEYTRYSELNAEQEKSLYNLVKDFIHAVKLDQHDWEDWPEDSREAFEKMLKWANSN